MIRRNQMESMQVQKTDPTQENKGFLKINKMSINC